METVTRFKALALACTLCSGAALAEVQGEATLGNLRFTLFDLDPDDAVTPSLAWALPPGQNWGTSSGGLSAAYNAAADDWSWSENYNRYVTAKPRAPAAIDYAPGAHAALSAAYAHPDPLGQVLSLSMRNAPLAEGQSEFRADVYAEQLVFRLSPNTRVSLSVDLSASASTLAQRSHGEYLRLLVSFGVVDYLNYGDTDFINLQRESGTWPGMAPGFAETGTLTVDFSNPYGSERYGDLHLSIGAVASAWPVSAVPEPSTHAMLLAGAVLFGWRRLRRAGAG